MSYANRIDSIATNGNFYKYRTDGYLGEKVTPGATVAEWAAKAGLDFEIKASPVFYTPEIEGAANVRVKVPNRVAQYRVDTGECVGFTSPKFHVHQPKQIWDFFHDACEEAHLEIDSMGTTKNGAHYWAFAKVGEGALLGGDKDPTQSYLMLTTACDGSSKTKGFITDLRLGCLNMLRGMLRRADGTVISQSHRSDFDALAMGQALQLADFETHWAESRQQADALASTLVSPETASAWFSNLLSPGSVPVDQWGIPVPVASNLLEGPVQSGAVIGGTDAVKLKRAVRGLADLEDAYVNAPAAVPGSAYGLVQAVTYTVDHTKGKDEGRRERSWFGAGNRLKDAAVEQALALAG